MLTDLIDESMSETDTVDLQVWFTAFPVRDGVGTFPEGLNCLNRYR